MSASHPFQVGDRVVCINDSPPRTSNHAPRLELGAIYTVTLAMFGSSPTNDNIVPGVCVAEAPFWSEQPYGFLICGSRVEGFLASRFELYERAPRP